MLRCFVAALIVGWVGVCSALADAAPRPNLLLITVDDMNADSVGVYGATVPGTTPHIDRLARQGLRFELAHVQVASCNPSRNVMWSGRYPHSSRVEGFYQVRDPDYPVLFDLLRENGYFVGIRGKAQDSTPYQPYDWDLVLDSLPGTPDPHGKDPASYGVSTAQGIHAARSAGRPFALVINILDPHVPFYGLDKRGQPVEDKFVPSRVYGPEDVTVPGFLYDDPVVRLELSHYYSSVRRADDAVGQVMQALEKSGEADNTLVMLLSDHGMPFPFAKTQLYHHSTRTPLVLRWPGVIKPDTVDGEHMVSAVDFLPTLLEVVGGKPAAGVEGRSFLPLLQGEPQTGRAVVFKEYNESASGQRAPMRAVQTPRFLYLFNPWSNGKRRMTSATLFTSTFRRMEQLAVEDKALAARLQLLEYRVPEEFYAIENDPDCLVNLIADPAYQADIERLRSALGKWMQDTNDPALEAFVHRDDPRVVAAFLAEQDAATRARREWKRAIRESLKRREDEARDGAAKKGSESGLNGA